MNEMLPIYVNSELIFVEVDQTFGSEDTSAVGKIAEVTENAFGNVKRTIVNISTELVGAIKQIDDALAPNEFSFEFAVKIAADGNVILTKVSGEAQFKVSMKYTHKVSS